MTDSTAGTPIPVSLKGDRDALAIEWSDGLAARLRWGFLRDHCPCATCRARRAEPPNPLPVLSPEEAAPVRGIGMEPLGNYAYAIVFSDGHNTGIYTLEFLRELCEQSAR